MLWHSLFQIGLVAWYQQNKDYVTAKYCINKDKPRLNCCGKCYLQKQLNKLNQNGDSPTRQGSSKSERDDCPVFVVPEYITYTVSFYNRAIKHNITKLRKYYFLHEILVFRPPQHLHYIVA
jgi:hypothetical protein